MEMSYTVLKQCVSWDTEYTFKIIFCKGCMLNADFITEMLGKVT